MAHSAAAAAELWRYAEIHMALFAVEWPAVAATASTISALIALGVAIMTAVFQIRSHRQTRTSNSARMVMELSLKFSGEEMIKQRMAFAKQLLAAKALKSANPQARDIAHQVKLDRHVPVLYFLEDLGYLTRVGVLDANMVWNSFIWEVYHYFQAMRKVPPPQSAPAAKPSNLIDELRDFGVDKTIYRELEWLFNKLVEIDLQEQGLLTQDPGPSDEELQEFLTAEADP
jgi:hypothetical protein